MDFPYGELVRLPPEGFVPPEMWPEYGSIAAPPWFCSREYIGGDFAAIRWGIWPLYFERHTGDLEPNLEKSKIGALSYNRLVTWNRILPQNVPSGWKSAGQPMRVDGFYDFRQSTDYRSAWSRIARRHLRTWQQQADAYRIEIVPLEQYQAAYKKSTVIKKTGSEGLQAFEKKCQLPEVRAQIQLWGVRNVSTGAIVAGLAAHYSARYNSSVHECPFVTAEGQRVHAAVGLMDHWFSESLRRGVALQLMTYFWFPGKPKSWKGFSEFKSHFGLRYYAYPPELTRFVRGKFL